MSLVDNLISNNKLLDFNMKFITKIFATISILILLFNIVHGADIYWDTNKSGVWSDPSNWSSGIIPDSIDNVYIERPGNYTITLDMDVSITSFTLGSSGGVQILSNSGHTITFNNPSTINSRGILEFSDNSQIEGSGTLTNYGTLNLENCTVNADLLNNALITVHGDVFLNKLFENNIDATLIVEGLTAFEVYLTIANGFTNHGIIELTSNDSQKASRLKISNGTFVNDTGALISSLNSAGGDHILDANINNHGTISIDQTLFIFIDSSPTSNSGTINLNGGNLILTQLYIDLVFSNSGVINIGDGLILELINGYFINTETGMLQGTGIIDINSAICSNSGDINPGNSPGILSVSGIILQDATGSLNFEIGGLLAGTEFDQLVISDSAHFEGNINLSLINNFLPAIGDSFEIISYNSCWNGFSSITGLNLGNRMQFKVKEDINSIKLITAIQNDPPIAVNDSVVLLEDTQLTIAALENDFDAEKDTLLLQKIDTLLTIGNAQIEAGDTLITYTPKNNYNGPDVIDYTVIDSYGGLSTGKIIASVLPVNDAPVLSVAVDTIQFESGSSFQLNIWELINDVETPDSSLIYQFNVTPDTLNLDFDADNGMLMISLQDQRSDIVTNLVITVIDPEGASTSDSITVVTTPTATKIDNYLEESFPQKYRLSQNYPNPFNPKTRIEFDLPKTDFVKMEVYNLVGQKIATLLNKSLPPGHHTVEFDANDLSTGVYLYTIQTTKFCDVKKMVLLR
jgi:hypothetical protein